MRKKLILFSVAALAGAGLTALARAETQLPLETVSHVDLTRYVGEWFEIAHTANWFEKKCTGDTTATYRTLPDGRIEVLNACRQSDGTMTESKGTAKVADTQTNAKLKVTFFWPFYGDYWIIGLDPNYRWAVVGEPDRKYLWILGRDRRMDDGLFNSIVERIKAQGYDLSALIKTQHAASRPSEERTRPSLSE